MPDAAQLAILFAVGSLAGVFNVMAGGGSTLTLPALIFLGLDAGTANGTNRVAILIQNISATASFRAEGVSELQTSLVLALWTLPGAVAGALAATRVSDAWFERILGIAMIGIVLSMVVPRPLKPEGVAGRRSAWMYPALFGIGFYGGFIQMGVGLLFMAAFFHLMRTDLVRATVHKVLIILIYTLPTLVIFAFAGHVDWLMGLGLAAGNATGGWFAARIAVRKGEKAVRAVLIAAILVMAVKILGLL